MDAKLIEVATGKEVEAEIRPAGLEDISLWRRWVSQMPDDAENGHWRWDEHILLAKMPPDRVGLLRTDGRRRSTRIDAARVGT